MKKIPKKHTCRALIGLVALTTLVMAVDILPALAQQRTIRVGSEAAMGGLTVAEQAARSLHLNEELMTIVPPGVANAQLRIEINQKDRDELAVTPPSGTAPLRVGVVKSVPGTVGKAVGQAFNIGIVEQNPDGSFVWAMTVTSPGAQAIRVHFTDFSLPGNTEMYFLGPNGQAHGPYAGKGRNNNDDFWTRSIVSDTGTLVLNYTGDTPDIDQPKMSFTISDVGHIRGRPPRSQERSDDTWPCSDNADCLVDVNCVDTGPASPAEDAVAKMEWIETPWIYTCSGGLLADTDPGTQIPYFLTAHHCLSSSNTSLETFFNYTTDSCNGYCPDNLLNGGTPPSPSTIGATVVATGSAGDFTLLTLDEAPPDGATFLGWNNAPVADTDGASLYRISNPNFGPQVYSGHVVDTASPQCTGWPRGERIYSKDITGATMGGSSGSPVLNSASEVVGQLSGSCGYTLLECDSENNWTVDGALAFYWDSVSEFLDPQPECTTNTECDDGLFCTGFETCESGFCQSSGDPCSDETGTVCNEATDTCDATTVCGDGNCEVGEDCNSCPNDCISGQVEGTSCTACFKGVCDGKCNPSKEGPDCIDCASSYCCGDGTCEGAEDSTSCEIDCPAQSCGGNKAPCSVNEDCCSNVCKNSTCRGN
jgi:hypothetical protein